MRKICIITGSRADFVPLITVVDELLAAGDVQLNTLETHGLYGNERKIKSYLTEIRPDMVVLLGDRYETLVAASVCALLAIPIAHLSGGDETIGAVDNAFRHAITKLAYWHFPICPLHADRIRQMGEKYDNIFDIGCPSVDRILEPKYTKGEVEAIIGIKLKHPVALVCYHPETLGRDEPNMQAINDLLPNYATVVISGANMDIGGDKINAAWEIAKGNFCYAKTFSPGLWMSLMHYADVLIGNSSGFIIEGMSMGKKFINIGDRQKGRYQDALKMFAPGINDGYEEAIEARKYPFGFPGTVAPRIAEKLRTLPIPETTQKVFNELG